MKKPQIIKTGDRNHGVSPKVVCAAIRCIRTGLIIAGARHFDEIMGRTIQAIASIETFADAEQGFIDQRGNFLTRQDAYILATENGQCKTTHLVGILYSEDLY